MFIGKIDVHVNVAVASIERLCFVCCDVMHEHFAASPAVVLRVHDTATSVVADMAKEWCINHRCDRFRFVVDPFASKEHVPIVLDVTNAKNLFFAMVATRTPVGDTVTSDGDASMSNVPTTLWYEESRMYPLGPKYVEKLQTIN